MPGIDWFTGSQLQQAVAGVMKEEVSLFIKEQHQESGSKITAGSDNKTQQAQVFQVKDSGTRKQFDSGMVRDTQEGKIDWWRVYVGPMLKRWAIHVTKGATKYPDVKVGTPNWTLAAGEEELFRFKASAARHFAQWLEGDMDEDHAAAVMFNINGHEYVKEKLRTLKRDPADGGW